MNPKYDILPIHHQSMTIYSGIPIRISQFFPKIESMVVIVCFAVCDNMPIGEIRSRLDERIDSAQDQKQPATKSIDNA